MPTTSSVGGDPTEALDPERLVSAKEAAQLLGLTEGRVRGWAMQRYLLPAGEGWLPKWTWRPHQLYRIKDLLYLKDRLGGSKTHQPAEGFVDKFHASLRLGVRPSRVVVLLQQKEIDGYSIPHGMKSVSWFVSVKSIDRWLIANSGDGEAMPPADGILPALICARDDICLKARRELWERKRRKWRKKFWKVLDGRKRTG